AGEPKHPTALGCLRFDDARTGNRQRRCRPGQLQNVTTRKFMWIRHLVCPPQRRRLSLATAQFNPASDLHFRLRTSTTRRPVCNGGESSGVATTARLYTVVETLTEVALSKAVSPRGWLRGGWR